MQVAKVVIGTILVFVVNQFINGKEPSKVQLHNYSMLHNFTMVIGARVIPAQYPNITFEVFSSPSDNKF